MKFNYADYTPIEMFTKFGITATHFYPFDEMETEKYRSDCGLTKDEYVEHLERYRQSTVYKGIRYFFKTPEQLQSFCELIEEDKKQ